MKNWEYEKLCVDSARKTTKEVAAEAVKNLDEKIKDAEKALRHLQEARRELVNRYDLNRCNHESTVVMAGLFISAGHPDNTGGCQLCVACGAKIR